MIIIDAMDTMVAEIEAEIEIGTEMWTLKWTIIFRRNDFPTVESTRTRNHDVVNKKYCFTK